MTDNNWAFIIAAYTVTWVVLLGYAAYVHRSLSRVRANYARASARAHAVPAGNEPGGRR